MVKKYKKQVKKFERAFKSNKSREFYNEMAVSELKAAAEKYNDIILNECIQRCAQIIFNQENTIMSLKFENVFKEDN